MKVISIKDKKWLELALETLQRGGLIIYPTETCYGLGVDSTHEKAITKVLAYKRRPEYKAISIATSNMEMAKNYVELNEIAENLYRLFLPGPLTVVSKAKNLCDPRLLAENQTLGVRIPAYPVILNLIEKFGKPITATSANQTAKKTPYSYEDIVKYSSKKALQLIDLFIDAGRLPHNKPSTVIDTTVNSHEILRRGVIKILHPEIFISRSEKQTQNFAQNLLLKLRHKYPHQCLIFSLQGDLGTGKTQFAKGLAKALQIPDLIVSPTFTIIKEYPFLKNHLFCERNTSCVSKRIQAKITREASKRRYPDRKVEGDSFIHLDTWRLPAEEKIKNFLENRYFKTGNIIAIEWSEKILPFLQNLEHDKNIVNFPVSIEHLGENQRKITTLKI